MPSHLLYFKGLWLPYVLLLDLLSHLRASGPSSVPKCLCGQVCVFSFQLSHFYHQNEAVERKGEPLETLKRKKNLVIQFSANPVLPLAAVQTDPNKTGKPKQRDVCRNLVRISLPCCSALSGSRSRQKMEKPTFGTESFCSHTPFLPLL